MVQYSENKANDSSETKKKEKRRKYFCSYLKLCLFWNCVFVKLIVSVSLDMCMSSKVSFVTVSVSFDSGWKLSNSHCLSFNFAIELDNAN